MDACLAGGATVAAAFAAVAARVFTAEQKRIVDACLAGGATVAAAFAAVEAGVFTAEQKRINDECRAGSAKGSAKLVLAAALRAFYAGRADSRDLDVLQEDAEIAALLGPAAIAEARKAHATRIAEYAAAPQPGQKRRRVQG